MPASNSKTYIVNDQPTERDALDFTPYVETLADIIQTGNTPLTIGVFGGWGSGKTSLMRMVKNQLPKKFTVAWFDAWKYDKEETLWRAFLLSVLTALRREIKEGQPIEDLEYLETMLYRGIEIDKAGGVTIDLAKLGGAVAKGGVQLALSFIPGGTVLSEFVKKVQQLGAEALTDEATEAIQRERTKIQIEQVRFLEQFQGKFRILIEQHVSNSDKRLVVFVDDLDRCLPEKAIQVLEAIKLFLDVQDCVFVLGIDQDVIARGIEMKYKDVKDKKDAEGKPQFTIEGIKYLEKIIQLPFQIPPVIQDDMGKFVEGLSNDWAHEDCHKVFAEGLGDNPRNIKRTVNTFLMLSKLAEKRKEKLKEAVKPIRLAKVVAIQAAHPDLFNLLLKEEPRYLRELEEYYLAETKLPNTYKSMSSVPEKVLEDAIEGKAEIHIDDATKAEPPPALVPFLSQRGSAAVRRILTMKHKPETQDATFAGLSTDELKLYFTLTRSAEAPQAAPPPAEVARLVFEPQMVRIPTGKFLMGTTKEQAAQVIKEGGENWKEWVEWEQPQHTVELSEYFIGKYPITNREYQAFLRDVKDQSPPRGWDGDQFPVEKGGHPVVNVSWDDANAYCKWLSEKTKKNYRLPTEAEWEKAARGEDGRVYPWGNAFDPKKANTSESKIGDTTDVGKFSSNDPALSGDSPYGCADMAGNVWEWCNDWFSEKEYQRSSPVDQDRTGKNIKDPQGPENGTTRCLRGGSWTNVEDNARVAIRYYVRPSNGYDSIGFRVALLPSG